MKTRYLYLHTLVALVFLMLSPSVGLSQSEEGLPVVSVDIVGNRAVSAQLIRAQIQVREGRPFTRTEVQEDIRRLFSLGYFSDIKVDIKREGEGLAVTYLVTERKMVKEVLILGNNNVNESDITDATSLKRGQTYIPKSIEKDIAVIRNLYRSKGFSKASVSASYREISPTEVEVVYEITEGRKARVRYITIENNHAFTDRFIRKKMRTKARAFWFGSLFDDAVFENDMKLIKELYASHGYVDAEVTAADVEFFNEGERVRIKVAVEEGEQYFVDSVEVEGNVIFTDERLLSLAKTKPGDVYHDKRAEQDAKKIQDFYSDQGYILASAKPRIDIRREEKKAAIVHRITERDLVYVSKIDIKGNVKTKDSVVRRELNILPGERFHGGKIRRSRQKLLNTRFFEDVYIDTETSDEDNHRDLVFEVVEGKTGNFNFGMGYSSNDAFIGQVEVVQNNFDLLNPPTFTGAGQRFSLAVNPGTVLNEYRLGIMDPRFLGYPFAGGFDLFYVDREYDEYDQEYYGTGIRLGKRITDNSNVGLNYNIIRYDISNVDDDAPESIKQEVGTRTKSSLAGSLTHDTRNSVFDPETGHKYKGVIELAGGPLGAETDFVKLVVEARWYRPLIWKAVLLQRVEIGLAEEYGDSDFVPIFDRFFAGGSNSVRGYDYREVGPRVDDDPVGGKAKIEGTLEISYPIIDMIKGHVFFDFGQVWAEVEDFGKHRINTSVGLGVGLRTPVGPLRLDYGFPLNPDDDQGSGRLHFTTGISF